LRGEKGKYTALLKNMEAGLLTLKNELQSLETMLDDAIYVSDLLFSKCSDMDSDMKLFLSYSYILYCIGSLTKIITSLKNYDGAEPTFL